MFIAFDGIDGSGKSTQALKLYKNLQEKFPDREVIITNEPYDNDFAYDLYFQIQNKYKNDINWKIKTHLFGVARLQLWLKTIKPALDRKAIVISDRWYKSTLAYQGALNNNHDEVLKILYDLE
ncbi:MAG: thymidylate kinase, partial [Anaplasmataceae bacterium]|nr:thymidylate kinase [Anaplasmataceae bacterium]